VRGEGGKYLEVALGGPRRCLGIWGKEYLSIVIYRRILNLNSREARQEDHILTKKKNKQKDERKRE